MRSPRSLKAGGKDAILYRKRRSMDRREYVSAHLDVSPGTEKRLEMPSSDTPFRIVLLGDFPGRANRGIAADPRLRGRKAVAVDLDNFDDVLARMRPQLELPGP